MTFQKQTSISDNKPTSRSKTIIKTNNLSKYYGSNNEIIAVKDLDLEIFEGETYGLLGPNGAGKTTTIRILNSIIKPTNGTATINGFDTKEHPNEIKSITGLLAETPGLYEKLSPQEFLEFMGALYQIPQKTLLSRIDVLLKIFSLHERRNYLLEGFSTGMKQKVLIAAALIHDPKIVYFDEPTAGLDPRATAMVRDLISELSDQAGKTIVISSHILPVIEELCDRIGIIYQGRLVAQGTVMEIIEQTATETLEDAFMILTGGKRVNREQTWSDLMS